MTESRQSPRFHWAAYGASVLAFGYAAMSLYWAAGGHAALVTVGGFAQTMAGNRTARAILVLSLVVALKALGGLLALALAAPGGWGLPQRALFVAGTVASAVLILYGAVQVAAEALVETGAITPSGSVDWTALRWHLGVWDLWFLIWGLLLATATRGYRKASVSTHARRLAAR